MSHTTKEVINPLNQYTMTKGRYMLIHNDRDIYWFKWHTQAQRYAIANCRGHGNWYLIVDTEKNKVLDHWIY